LEKGEKAILYPISKKGLHILEEHGEDWSYFGSYHEGEAEWLALISPSLVIWVRSVDDINFRVNNNGTYQTSFDI